MLATARLNHAQKTVVREVLSRYANIFVGPDGVLGKTSVARHKIDLGTNRPLKEHLRRAPIAHQEVIDQEVDKMLERGVIEPSEGPWASPVVMLKKKTVPDDFALTTGS